VSTLVVPKPDVLALAELVPDVVESIAGAVADVESIVLVVTLESTVEGVTIVAESLVVAPLSEPLLQAARLPAIANNTSTFFMIAMLML
jgi:hypothetical protein